MLFFFTMLLIHHLSSQAIGLDQFDFVDGTHPTDGGMLKYAKAYQNKILNNIDDLSR
ncbi:hypothetical protein A33Q_4592 [Indibacter alkaliphilus LW1]|uniref:Uncharacterized protein n=2 Tax=Indibacter TaxID=647744 RepID=S2CY68_INDAL|nr:hypothetical protein A33Q_4592 [Indibacter alkaliphilus LW1]